MTEVILYDSDNTIHRLDVTSSVDIPLQFSVADVREPNTTKSTWSKTAVFFGTANNNLALKHVYEISAESNFNVNKKVRCVIIESGINTFVGYCRLLNIKRKNSGNNDYNRIQYELSFFGETASLFKELTGLYLHDLDFSEWNHNYTTSNITNSWGGTTVLNSVSGQNSISLSASKTISTFTYNAGYLQCNFSASHGLAVGDEILIVKTDNTTNAQYNGMFIVKTVDDSDSVTLWMLYGDNVGTETATAYKITMLGTGYVYPMVDYGLNFGDIWDVEHFFPAIYVKEYWDKIFTDAGYTYDSAFLDSQFFKHLIVPFNRDTFNISNDEVLERQFKASYSADDSVVTDSATGNNYTFGFDIDLIPDNDSTGGNNDDYGNYYVPTGEYTAPVTGYYNFDWNIFIQTTLDSVPVGYTRNINLNYTNVRVYVNGVNTTGQTYISTFNSTTNLAGQSTSLFLTAGDVVTFHVGGTLTYTLYSTSLGYYTTSQDVDFQVLQGSTVQCRIVNTVINEGATIEMNNAVPRDILQADFLTWIIKMFKLFVQPDPSNSKHLLIEPRDDFYSSTVLNWTNKLDINRDIEITPMAELNAKRYTHKYKSDKDAFNQNHEQYYGEVYGTQIIDVDNDFVTGESVLEIGFSASPLIDYPVGTDRVITSIVKDGTITQNRTASNIRILYYSLKGTNFPYTATYNAGSTQLYSYPYAGHLDNVWLPYYDLNFGFPKATYFNYGAWTDNNLYNRFHRQYVEEVTDRHSKIITAWLHIKPSDINNLDFAKLIRIDEHLLRLNKIIDYNSNNNGLTKCEFIKVKSGFTFTPERERVSYGSGATVGGYTLPIHRLDYSQGSELQKPRSGGYKNTFVGNNRNCTVNGDNNFIDFGAKNIIINGSNNTIQGDLENVIIYGDDTTATHSNTTYINGVAVSGDGSITTITTNLTYTKGTGEPIYKLTLVDATSGNISVFLPPADEMTGVELEVKKIDSSANTVTVNPNSTEVIDDSTTLVIVSQYDAPKFVSDGNKWWII